MHGPAGEAALRPGRVLRRRAADEVQGGALPHRHGLVRHPGRARRRRRRVHEQGPRRRRVPLLVPRHRGLVPDRAPRRRTRRYELGVDPARAPARQLHPAGAVPVPRRRPASSTTPATTRARCDIALDKLGYDELRARAGAGARGGPAARHRHRVVHRGRRRRAGKDYDIAGLRMFDSAELRVHPTGKAILKLGVKSQGQGHETTFAQIVAEELGIPAEDVEVQEGDTDNTPYGLGTYASRSTPMAGAATAVISRKLRDKARKIAAHLLEASRGRPRVRGGPLLRKGSPDRAKTIQDVAFAAYTDLPDGMEAGLEGVTLLRPAEHDLPVRHVRRRGRGRPRHRRSGSRSVVAVDDCGVRINPMIVEGQIMGGLTEGYAIGGDAADRLRRGRQLHRLELHGLPDPDRVGDADVRARRDGDAVAAPPDRREGRRRVGHGRLARRVRERGRSTRSRTRA